MTENLRLGANKTLTTSDSDVGSTFVMPASASGVWGTGSAWNDVSQITDAQINTKHLYDNGSYTVNDGNGVAQKAGVYYNWYTATAGSGTASTTSGEAPYSICPKGWMLPPTANNKSWATLIHGIYGAYTGDSIKQPALLKIPVSLAYTGYYMWCTGQVDHTYPYGLWWSSTAYSRVEARPLQLDNSSGSNYTVGVGVNVKAYGFPIRCVSR
ncbi:hypothetical protein IJG27_00480 [Candidatus Saccharibacteria bacterium]|nr:hypothetical protein [Candidatus Saccharibacteria bacterium]MBQ6127377.1 hypothetical protein [Candidatus Saccharibacteria bacterium]